jgi:hypothetical protein
MAARLHDVAGSWIPVFGVVIALDLLAAVLAIAVLKPLRRRMRQLAGQAADRLGVDQVPAV